jgi:cell division transport system ATP-binding protein
VIRLDHVVKQFPAGPVALAGLTLTVPVGQLVVLSGPSGSGKSTALHLCGFYDRPTRGRIVIGGTDLSTLTPRDVPHYRRRVSLVFQDQRLLLDRSIEDNVGLPLTVAGLRRAERAPRIRDVLEQLGIPHDPSRSLRTLSVGEQQRIGIARALVHAPDVLLADEPTSHQDSAFATRIFDLFQSVAANGVTVLVATHDLSGLAPKGARQIRLDAGRVASDTHA